MKWFTLLIAFFVLINGLADAKTPDEIRIAIQGKMRERHPDQLPDFWRNLGPDAVPVLKKMVVETQAPFEKSWLLNGLSYFDDPGIADLIKNELGKIPDDVSKKKMLSSLIQSQGEGAYEYVEPYLTDEDADVRRAVAQGLKEHASGNPRVDARLKEFIAIEKQPAVKAALEKTKPGRRNVNQDRNIYSEKPTFRPSPTPLPEKHWAGEWKGAWMTTEKNVNAVLNLTLLNEKPGASQQKWRIELKLPKQSKIELKESEVDLLVFQTASAHWIEIRSRKSNSVFVAQRSVKE